MIPSSRSIASQPPGHVRRAMPAVAAGAAGLDERPQIPRLVGAVRHRERRKARGDEAEVEGARPTELCGGRDQPRGSGGTAAPARLPSAARTRPRPGASRPPPRDCAGPGPRRAPSPARSGTVSRSGRSSSRRGRGRRGSRVSARASLRASSSGVPWSNSSTMTLSRPNASTRRASSRAAAVGPSRAEGHGHGAAPATGEHAPVARVCPGEEPEIESGPALLAPGELGAGDRRRQTGVPLGIPRQHDDVDGLGVDRAGPRLAPGGHHRSAARARPRRPSPARAPGRRRRSGRRRSTRRGR